ncbi:MAG TPA: LptF/LptG family permease [Candidatus Deferrimicrobium sp.]|nr:LptF/LptG family permease [Candidatus Deferrimicrobium sp.]
MKILSRYILKEHLAPFLFAFFTITFLLIIDFVPKIVNSILDKNLPVGVVFELIALNLAWMIALSVPMSVLVSTLMAFGRLTSDFEVTALKTSGVNLIRVIAPLLVAGAVITALMIGFNDRVLPDLNKRARALRSDISRMRPTLVFRSGIFVSDVPGYLILIDKIDHATSRVEGVHITVTKDPTKPQIIVADHGYLHMADNGRTMRFTLLNGELHSLDIKDPQEYHKVDFQQQVINISGTGSELERTDSEYRTDREMSIEQMETNVTRAEEAIEPFRARIRTAIYNKVDYLFASDFAAKAADTTSDSAALASVKMEAESLLRLVTGSREQIESQRRVINKYRIEIYKKYSIPAASLAFVLIGAPLAVLSRRGGMGMAVAFSILLFTVYWAFLIGGEDLADRDLVSPFWAMWGANILIGSIGLYLLYVVVTERPVLGFFLRRH